MTKKLALLGGQPTFPDGVRFVRPWLPKLAELSDDFETTLASGMLTNATYVKKLEERAATRLDVPHVVAVNNCTAGLILLLRCLGVKGKALLPSFTFCATGHAASWNGLGLRFADADPKTYCIDIASARSELSEQVGVIIGTHIFGCPADAAALAALSEEKGIPLIFDAAHAFGSTIAEKPVSQFGIASVYSLTPTKVIVAGEGGVIATRDAHLANELRAARNYGDTGDYDCKFIGLNARMPEWCAILGNYTVQRLDEQLQQRHAIVAAYIDALKDIPGISFQKIPDGYVSTYKDFSLMINDGEFGVPRDVVARALDAEGVGVKKYFNPALHNMQCYQGVAHSDLPVTERLSREALSLPIYPDLTRDTVLRIADLMQRIREHRADLSAMQ